MISDRERRDIVTALKNIVFLEDDETYEEYCEVGDILDALDIHPELGEYLYHDDVDRLVDIVGARWSHGLVPTLKSSVRAHRYRLNGKALKIWMIENDVTCKRLGEMLGVSPMTLGNWINKGIEPRVGAVLALADVTGMDIYDLMEVADEHRSH